VPSRQPRRLRRQHWHSLPQAREAAEISGQPEQIKDRLVRFPGVWPPASGEAVVPPRVREFAQLDHRRRGTGPSTGEPPLNLLFRPEEIHGASAKDNVVPPLRRGHEKVEEQARVVRKLIVHGNGASSHDALVGGLQEANDLTLEQRVAGRDSVVAHAADRAPGPRHEGRQVEFVTCAIVSAAVEYEHRHGGSLQNLFRYGACSLADAGQSQGICMRIELARQAEPFQFGILVPAAFGEAPRKIRPAFRNLPGGRSPLAA
jgi:hypothetical protein